MANERRQYVYLFGGGSADGNASMKELLGGKGANLAEMAGMGLPVPPGFTITTEVCSHYFEEGGAFPAGLEAEIDLAMAAVERLMGKKFGDPGNPLLYSVRSGAPASMPGMMDTILNLGLNDEVAARYAKAVDARFVYDSYRRLVTMYADVVLGVSRKPFEKLLGEAKARRGVEHDHQLPASDLEELVGKYKELVRRETGGEKVFPQSPREQLWGAIGAVFRSWNNPRAIAYRGMNNIPAHWGTAVNVQAMVFGNIGEDCATGVGFTRDPATGEKRFFAEWLPNAQGEDVVAGIRTPRRLDRATGGDESLEALYPTLYAELDGIQRKIETHFRDMQDVEFTIERGKLYMLQTRNGKRTGLAALRIAVELVAEGLIDEKTALLRVQPEMLNQIMRPIFDAKAKKQAIDEGRLLATGLPAGPGAATGRIALSPERAEAMVKQGPVILVREETSPEDIRGMAAAQGILTQRGGMTSHAALVARQMGKVCVVGCAAVSIDEEARTLQLGKRTLKEGDYLSIDGSPNPKNKGEVIEGKVPTKPSPVMAALFGETEEARAQARESGEYRAYEKIMGWADEYRRLEVWTNADQPGQARQAVAFGAQGIGLCRTEHMFFEGDRIKYVRQMILARDEAGRKAALDKLMPMQRGDFAGLFEVMHGRPVTIRTLDPPLHEFLPHDTEGQTELAKLMDVDLAYVQEKVEALKESNPMLGNRGCRLGITFPEITAMQARAIFEAALEVKAKGIPVKPEIMIPLVGHWRELEEQAKVVRAVAEEVFAAKGARIDYHIGTMIELPRAALTADEIAKEADFFSFGTNDLTQTTFGLSRDDTGPIVAEYQARGIWEKDPFASLDQTGVGLLIKIAVEKGRGAKPELKVGICGEHGGDPASVEFCHRAGLTYVSCSPFRVPIARIAAARAALEE
jgi:pyruvate,orthophosphate dikinase